MAMNIAGMAKKQASSSAGQLGGIPIFILKEGAQRSKGKEAQSSNISAAKAVAAAVRTTLGPKGMDKMLVNTMGDVVITGDGATILKEMDIEHPAAKMIVEVAKTQDEEVGDGTTTAVIITGELLSKAEELFDMGVHATVIVGGYRLAAEKSKEILEGLARDVSVDQEDILLNIAATSIKGREDEATKMKLAQIAVSAVKAIAEVGDGKKADTRDIKVEKIEGGSTDDTELVRGIVIEKERATMNMPRKVENARILLLNKALEIKKTETKSKINIETPEQMMLFLDQEENLLQDMVSRIGNTGANVVFCSKGIDDVASDYLAKSGIFAVKSISDKDMEKISKAIEAKVLADLKGASENDLGKGCMIEEKKIGDKKFIFIRDCSNPKSVSVLLHGGTKHVVESLEITFNDALRVVGAAIEDGKFVVGGGSPEVEVALRLREYSASLTGREQLAVYKFADAIDIVPKTLAENAGLDSIDMLVELRSQHEQGNKNAGLDVYTGKVVDMAAKGIIEPLRVKIQAINSATEAAEMILRIDDVIAAGKGKLPAPMPEEY
jgi:thermosome